MRPTTRALAAVTLATAAVIAASQGSSAAPVAGRTLVFTLDPSTHGNPEGVAVDPRSGDFFVGTVGDGTIYRGSLADPTVRRFIAGIPGQTVAVGMKVSRGLLYVAGGPTAAVNVYDVRSGALRARIAVPGSGFLNDLVVTDQGDVWVTDSFVPTLWRVTAAQVKAGHGTATGLSVGPEIAFTAGAFNLNGIVALTDHVLVVVHSGTGDLWRIALRGKGRSITRVDAPSVPGGDGMIVDRGRLVVVQGGLEQLSFLSLRNGGRRAVLSQVRTDPALVGPSTVARAGHRYLVVNADFTGGATPFTLAALTR